MSSIREHATSAASASGRLGWAESAFLCLAGFGVLLALAIGVVTRPGQEDSWFWLLVCGTLLVFPLFVAALQRRFDALEPIYIVCATYLLYFVYAPAQDLLEGKEFFFGLHVSPLLPRAMAVATLGCVCMLIGYYAPWGSHLKARVQSFAVDRRAAVLLGLAIGGAAVVLFTAGIAVSGLTWIRFLTLGQLGVTAAQALTLEAEDSPFLSYLISAADAFTPAFMMLFAFMTRRRWLLLLVVLAVGAVYTTIGFRYKLVILFLAPVVYAYLRSGRRPKPIWVAGAAIAASLIIGLIGSQRLRIRAGQPIDPNQLSVVAAQEAFNRDVSLYQPFAALVQAYPHSYDHLWGTSMLYVFVHPVPRGLWPEKPQPPIWTITENAFNSREPRIAGVSYPNIGEYYVNFGWLGVALLMALFGVGMRMLYAFVLRNRDNEWIAIIYAILLPFLVQFVSRGYLVAMVQYAAFLIGPVLVSMLLLRRRRARDAVRHRTRLAAGRFTLEAN